MECLRNVNCCTTSPILGCFVLRLFIIASFTSLLNFTQAGSIIIAYAIITNARI
jgi:hypothetical protein